MVAMAITMAVWTGEKENRDMMSAVSELIIISDIDDNM